MDEVCWGAAASRDVVITSLATMKKLSWKPGADLGSVLNNALFYYN